MTDSFNMLVTAFELFMFFKRKNFTIVREFEFCGKNIKEYVYNLKRYWTDVWPPPRGIGPPIKAVTRDSDGLDVTKNIIKFSGPMKNYINPLGLCTKKRKLVIQCKNLGVHVSYEPVWEPYTGTITVTDALGTIKKMIRV